MVKNEDEQCGQKETAGDLNQRQVGAIQKP
jgi:hypothetical protein